jgi:hypothetical protein
VEVVKNINNAVVKDRKIMNKIKPKLITINASNLHLDSHNPRLPESIQNNNSEKIWEHMNDSYNLDELALSMSENGYFEAEPMVVIPKGIQFTNNKDEFDAFHEKKDSEYIVVEGNRRLSTIQGLLNGKLNYPISSGFKAQLSNLPVLCYPNREDVLSFLGAHHLMGVRKWDVYERVIFIKSLKRTKNLSIEEIQKSIGDRKNSARKLYGCYRLMEIIQEYDESFDLKDIKKRFSLLIVATGQGLIKKFIGLPSSWSKIEDIENPIPEDKYENLKDLLSFIFDNGTITKAVIPESRDISKLSRIVNDTNAITVLRNDRDFNMAYKMIGGDLEGMHTLAKESKKNLEVISGKLAGLNIYEDVIPYDYGKELKKVSKIIKNLADDINNKFNI